MRRTRSLRLRMLGFHFSKSPSGTDLGVAGTVLIPEFGVEAEAEIPQVEMLTLNVPSEVVSQLCTDRDIVTNDRGLEKLGIDRVSLDNPTFGKRDVESETILHNLLTHPTWKLRIVVG